MEALLRCIMDIGEQMLVSGAEVHRVEESVSRMCRAFGAVRTDVFIITSSIVVTVYTAEGRSYTQTRRIVSSSSDFERLHALNKLCRRICRETMTEEKIKEELESIAKCRTYPFWLECLCYAIIAAAFTVFFGGGFVEMAVSFAVGAIVRLGILLSDTILTNKIFSKFFSAATATLCAFVAVKLGVVESVDKIIIGNIMSLIPGIGLTNALRDLFIGDSIAGLLRSIEALLIALAIAAGYFLVAVIGGFAV